MWETWNVCYVGSVKAGGLELVLCGFHKCGRLGTCFMINAGDLELVYVGSVNAGVGSWNLCYVGSINAGDLELVLCGFRKCGRLGTCVMWVP